MQSPRRPRPRLRRAAFTLLLLPLFAALGPVWADPLADLDLGAATLAPAFAPETADYTTALPALQGGFIAHPRVASAGQTLQVRDVEGRFRRVSPGATLAAGRRHFLALRDDGSVVAWGPASYGETTVPVAAQSGVVAVAAGHYFSLALKPDGSVLAWGQYASSSLAVPAAAQSGVVAIAGGSGHALALKTDGSVVSWGSFSQSSVPVAAQSGVVAIAAGANHSLALKADGSVVAWGSTAAAPVGAQSGVVAIAAQAGYSVAVKADGSLVCWGTPPSAGFPSAGVAPVVGVAASTNHLATLRADGGVQVWTSNNYPQLLTIPDSTRGAVALTMGDNVAAALMPDGRVVTWGAAGDAGLVVPATAARLRLPAAARLASPVGSTAIEWRLAASGDVSPVREPLHASSYGAAVVLDPGGAPLVHGASLNLPASATGLVAMRDGLGLKADGSLVAWSPYSGAEESVPVEIAAEPAAAISTVASQRFVLSRTGVVRGWSSTGPFASLLTVPAAAQSGVASVETGGYHQLALKGDGSVVAWGDNGQGQTTVPASALTGVVAVAAGRFHSVALRADRTLVFWGRGYTNTGLPAYEYRAPKPVAKIAAGEDTTAVLFTDGELVMFGYWSSSQSNLVYNQPATARADVADVAFGYSHVSVLKTDGTLLSWGSLSGTHATGLATLRAGPPGDALRLAATRAAPSAELTTLLSSGGEFSPALGADTRHLSQTLPSTTRGITLRASGPETRAGLEVSVNGDPVRRFAGGASLASGNNFDVGITRQGKVVAWGVNTTLVAATPTDLADAVSVAVGANHALALRADGSIRAWSGQSGSYALMVPASARHDVAAVAAYPYADHCAVLKRDGTPVVWGPSGTLNNIPAAAASGVSAIALGAYHALALKTDGSVVSWGSFASPPAAVSSGVVAIASGESFALALKADGSVVSWGSASYGLNSVPGSVGNRAVAIAACRSQAFALLSDGSVVAWGDTAYGVMPASATTGVIAISAGQSHASVLKADGSLVSWGFGAPSSAAYADIRLIPPANALLPVRSGVNLITVRSVAAEGAALAATPLVAGRDRNWFLRADGALDSGIVNLATGYSMSPAAADRVDVASVATGAYGEYAVRFDGTIRTLSGATPPSDLTTLTTSATRPRVLRVAVGQSFACALLEDRTLRFWSSSGSVLPAALSGEFVAITAGPSHVVATRADGRAVVWGEVSGAVATAPAFTVQAVAAGRNFNLALKPDGTLAAWGTNTAVLAAVPTGDDFVAVAAGDYHAVALRADGSVVAWGQSTSGQTDVPALARSGVVSISAIASHTLALRADGQIVAWGDNAFSPGVAGYVPGARREYRLAVTRTPASPALAEFSTHLGAPTPAFEPATLAYAQDVPASVAALRLSARAVDPGVLQLRANGRPFERVATGASLAAGNGFVIGIDPRGGAAVVSGVSSSFTIIPASAQSDLVAIAAGAYHILAQRADGTLVAWGSAPSNVLGIPTAASDIAAIAANNYNSLALRRDGQVVGWGSNSTLATVPADLGADNRAIALGYNHALVLKNDGSVVQWGSSPALPAEVSSGVVAIAAGFDYSLALKADGSLVAWGAKTTMSVLPEAARTDVVAISAAPLCALAIKRDGSRVIWSHLNASAFTPPATYGDLIAVAGGESGAAGLSADGRVSLAGNYTINPSVVPRPIIRPLAAPLAPLEGVNRIDLRVAPAPGRPLFDASFSAGLYANAVVTAAGSVRFGKVASTSPEWTASLPTAAQSDVIGVFTRGSRHVILRADGRVVVLPGGAVPQELQPGYTYSSASLVPARAVAFALGSSETLTLRADGTVFAWQNDTAVPADARTGVASIASDPGSYFYAVRADGRLVKWSTSGAVDTTLPVETKTGVIAVVSTLSQALVLKADGTLYSWRSEPPYTYPLSVPAEATDIVAVASSDRNFLALRRDGVVFSWGHESALGTVPAAAQSGVVAITAGPRHALALREDGTIVSWGLSASGGALVTPSAEGLLAEPVRTYSLTANRAFGSPDFGALRVALGELSPAFAPGGGDYALSSTPYRSTAFHGRLALPLGPVEIAVNGGAPSVRLPGATVATSDQAVLALRPDGTVAVFGSGPVATVPPAAQTEVVALTAGREHAVALKRDGGLVAWGSSSQQQLLYTPAGKQFVAVAAGDYHTLALTAEGAVVAWGSSYDYKLVPQAGVGFTAIAAGEHTSIALRADGSVLAWGKNSPVPQTVPVEAQSGVVAVAAGSNHYLALRADGSVVEWGGWYSAGTPTHGIVAIAAAGDQNFALRADGRVLFWDSGSIDPFLTLTPDLTENVSAFAIGRRLGALLGADGSLRVASSTGSSLTLANGTAAYAGPFALPVSARVPLALGANAVDLSLVRFDAALPPVVHEIAVERLPAPEWRITAGSAPETVSAWRFGEVAVGASATQALTLHNPGTADLVVSEVGILGTGAADFSTDSLTAPLVIPPGGSHAFTVTVVPSSAAWRNGILAPSLNLPGGEYAAISLIAQGFTHASKTASWRAANFTSAEMADPALEATVWGDHADPDGDGLPNLLEYALGLAPRAAGASPVTVAHENDPERGPVLKLSYTRPKQAAAAGLVYRVVASDTLAAGSWSALEVEEEIVASDATTETIEAVAPASGSRRFLRLEITAP